jgi:alkylation response protein AidB-like acyl-CoA dehydrogenase
VSASVDDATQSREGAVERAPQVFPSIRSQARAAHDARSLPREVVDAFVETGLVSVIVPQRWGASELGLLAADM